MAKCEKCGIEVPEVDLYDDNGKKVCEDCKIKSAPTPAKPCGGEK